MRALPSVSLAVLVILAGCSGRPVGGDDSSTRVTPANVPTDSADFESGTIAPGVTKTEIVSVPSIIETHEEVLANRSVTIEQTARSVAGNGTVMVRANTSTRISANRTQYARTRNITEHNKSGHIRIIYDIWYDGSVMYSINVRDGNKTYEKYVDHQNDFNRVGMYETSTLKYFLNETTNVSIKQVSGESGVDRYRVRGELRHSTVTTPASASQPYGEDENTPDRTGSLSAIIDERGFVHEYEVTYETHRNNSTRRINMVTRYQNLTTTTVERPSWVDEASATENTSDTSTQNTTTVNG